MSEKMPPYRVLRAIHEHYWAMLESAYETMLGIVASRVLGSPPTRAEKDLAIEAAQAAASTRRSGTPAGGGSIVVMNLFGIIAPRMGAFEDVSQEGTAMDAFAARYSQAMRDPGVGGVVVNVDSPGGSVFGVQEAGDVIYSFRDTKPNTAVFTGMGASAAFWIGTQFARTVGSPGADIGSVGVLSRHDDLSKAAELAGIGVEYITAPEGGFKEEGNPFSPLSESARAHYRERVGEYYEMFVKATARGRGTQPSVVREKFGKGRMYGAKRALDLGMIDAVSTLGEEIDRMASKLARKGGGARAESAEDDAMPELKPERYMGDPQGQEEVDAAAAVAGEAEAASADRERMARANLLLAGAHRGDAHP